MKASVAIQVLPDVSNEDELIRIVDEVIAYIKSTGLNYYVGPFETTIEGESYDELMEIVTNCQKVAIKAGCPSVSAYIKVVYNPEGEVLTIDKKLQSITNKTAPLGAIIVILLLWFLACDMEFVPAYMLPSPIDVVKAFADNFSIMMKQAAVTLQETLYGLLIGIAIAFVIASLMDRFTIINKALYPVLVVTQTIPTIAIAPLLVLWMGFGMAPKITLVVITTFFPIAIGLLNGFQSVDEDAINLMRSMGARRLQIFRIIKLPNATASFFGASHFSRLCGCRRRCFGMARRI